MKLKILIIKNILLNLFYQLIDKWKNKGLLRRCKIKKGTSLEKQILKIYSIYQKKTKDLNAFDFGDLMLFSVKLFENHNDIRLKFIENILNIS